MRRDFDLIRTILLGVEEDGAKAFSRAEEPTLYYQAMLLHEAGYVRAVTDDQGITVFRLTRSGHDFLDSVRDDSIWNSTKDRVRKVSGSASLEVVKAVAESITKAMLGLS